MQKPKSKFIQEKIKNIKLNSQNKKYIKKLLALEDFIINGIHSMYAGYYYHNLKSWYKKEWRAIYNELKPEEFKKITEKERKKREKEEREEAMWKLEEKREKEAEERELKNMWKRYGGKL